MRLTMRSCDDGVVAGANQGGLGPRAAGAGFPAWGRLIRRPHGRPQPGILRLEGADPFSQGLNLVQQVPDRVIEEGRSVPSPWRFGRRGYAHDGGWPYVSVPRSGSAHLRVIPCAVGPQLRFLVTGGGSSVAGWAAAGSSSEGDRP